MTYQSVLDQFKAMLSSVRSYECFTSGGGTNADGTSWSNPAGALISSWISTMETVKNNIFTSLDCLFNDPYAEYPVEDDNYQMINGYADASSSYDYFDESIKEFISKPEYFYIRGNMYDMLPKANEGEYLYKYIGSVNAVISICDEYQQMYDDSNYTTITNVDGTTTSKAEQFWSDHYSDFRTAVNSKLQPIENTGLRFLELKPFIKNYKDLFYQVSIKLSKAESFVAAINKTTTGRKTRLSDSFENIGTDGFTTYSASIGKLYSLYKKSQARYKQFELDKTDFSYNSLRKIYYSDILVYYNFYSESKNKYDWILAFRQEFKI